ncbi:MAG: hypothetical protein HUJ69_08710 [Lachnospiraceae bacterium]|nr:hypothetical protein [Lachnospiraceae bacterium]
MSSVFEAIMLISFGFSWPVNAVKAYKLRTAKSTSLAFLLLIEVGYVCGILAKILSGNINYVIFFYILNFVIVSSNIIIYFRNRKLDKEAEKAAEARE